MWKAVPEVERREIYVDVQHNLAKKEKEDAKALTKRNKKRLGEILDQVRQVNYRVTILRGNNLLLTWIWDVLPSCLGSR